MSLLFATVLSFGHAVSGEPALHNEDALLRRQSGMAASPRRIPFAENAQLFDGPDSDRRRLSGILNFNQGSTIGGSGNLAHVQTDWTIDSETGSASGCYGSDLNKIEGCTCDASCEACGFTENPSAEGECVACGTGKALLSPWAQLTGDPRGYCVAVQEAPKCVGHEVPVFHYGSSTPEDYCQMGGAGFDKGAHCARAWKISTGTAIPCDEVFNTFSIFHELQVCCINEEVLEFPAVPNLTNRKKVCHLDGRISKVANSGMTKTACEGGCLADITCSHYAFSTEGGCSLYRDCSKLRSSGETYTVYAKTANVLIPTSGPTAMPTAPPSVPPTNSPTDSPTEAPTTNPTKAPTKAPTRSPTLSVISGDHGDNIFHTGGGVDTVEAQGTKLIVNAADRVQEIRISYDAPRYIYWDAQAGEIVITTQPRTEQ